MALLMVSFSCALNVLHDAPLIGGAEVTVAVTVVNVLPPSIVYVTDSVPFELLVAFSVRRARFGYDVFAGIRNGLTWLLPVSRLTILRLPRLVPLSVIEVTFSVIELFV